MHGCAGHFARILNDGDGVASRRRNQNAGIAHLSAGLGVKRRAVEHQFGVAIVFDHAQQP